MSVAANLGRSLRARMDDRYKGIIDSALRIGKIRFKSKIGGARLSVDEQIKSIEAILELIAKDSMNDRVQRVVRMSQDIYSCKRGKDETFQEFASRFQYAANAFLSYTQSGSNHINELNFAMICLENARMDVSKYNHLVDTLISKAQNDDYNHPVNLDHVEVTEIVSIMNNLSSSAQEMKDCTSPTEYMQKSVSDNIRKATDYARELESRLNVSDREDNDKINVHITLDSTLATLRNMKSLVDINKKNPVSNSPSDSTCKTGEAVDTINKLGTMMSNVSKQQDKNHNRFYAKKRKNGRQKQKGDQDRQKSQHHDGDMSPPEYDGYSQDDYHILKKARTILEQSGPPEPAEDLNPILDPGAPTTTGGIVEAAKICKHFGIPLILKPPRDTYKHGWGQDCHDPRTIVCTWTVVTPDRNGQLFRITFDLVNGSSPLVVGLNLTKHADIISISEDPHILIKRPQDTQVTIFDTYISLENGNPKCIRLRGNIFPQHLNTITAMMGSLMRNVEHDPLRFARRVHRYTDAHPQQPKYLCDRAGVLHPDVENAIDSTSAACTLCTQTGRPLPSKKISLTHVNEAFNEEVQIDFTLMTIFPHQTNNQNITVNTRLTLIVMRDTGTGYTEAQVVDKRSINSIISSYERLWICKHGASKRVSADDEYNRRQLTNFFAAHSIEYHPRPTRRHNKTGLVERKNAVLKEILRRLLLEKSNANIPDILARATFFTNIFRGTSTLSAFELARGYQPSMAGLPQTNVTRKLMDAHTEQNATRALQRVLKSHTPNITTPGMFKPNDDVWVWYSSTKNNEPDEWVPARVVAPNPHYLEVRRVKDGQPCRGPTMRPAYEDIRIAPKGQLAQSLLDLTLEEELGYGKNQESEQGEERIEPNVDRDPPPIMPALLAQATCKKGPSDDIGVHATLIEEKPPTPPTLASDKPRIMEDIYENIGSHQVSKGKLDSAPPWILAQAFDKELTSNWLNSIEVVPESSVPKHANVISSHCVYKVKTPEDGSRDLKSRIVPHGNRDDEKDNIRKDSATAQLSIIRLLLSITTFLGFRLAVADIKGAYLQSGPIKREIFVRPPPEWRDHHTYLRYHIWRLLELPYGIVEAGRQWLTTVEEWMIESCRLERVFRISQLFVKRDSAEQITLLIAKVTDDFLIAGKLHAISRFLEQLKERFDVGKALLNERFHFNGCEIEQSEEGHIKLSMHRYLDRIRPISVSRARRKEGEQLVTEQEMKQYWALAGTLLYLGNGVLPQASLVVSVMQQRTSTLRVQHLINANEMVKEIVRAEAMGRVPQT